MKRIIFCFVSLCLSTVYVFSQAPLNHKKQTYTDAKGRYFINKFLPSYLRISFSPDSAAPSHLLKSETSPQYSNPFYFAEDGQNVVLTPWCVDTVTRKPILPKKPIDFEIYIDGNAPKTEIAFLNAPKYSKNGKIYFGKGLKIELTAKDEVSGVQQKYFSIDKNEFSIFKETDFNTDKEIFYQFYSVDNVGNAEIPQKTSFIIDLTPPQTSHQIFGDQFQNILSPRTTFKLNSVDEAAGVENIYFSFDERKPHIYKNEVSLKDLEQGKHILKFYATDNVKNQEVIKTFEFYLDKTPPTVFVEILGDNFVINNKTFSSGNSKIKLSAVDNKSGVKEIFYSVNGKEFQIYQNAFFISNQQGMVQVKVYSVDNVNNKSNPESDEGLSWGNGLTLSFVDLSGPELSHSFIGPSFKLHDTIFISGRTKISLYSSDKESGVKSLSYNLDKNTEVPYNQPFTVDSAGVHNVDFFSYDNVNNSNQDGFYFAVDNVGPEVFAHFSVKPFLKNSQTLEIYPFYVTLFLSATDDKVGYEKMYYSINGGAEKLYSAPIQEFKKGTIYSVKVRAVDKLGNVREKVISFVTE